MLLPVASHGKGNLSPCKQSLCPVAVKLRPNSSNMGLDILQHSVSCQCRHVLRRNVWLRLLVNAHWQPSVQLSEDVSEWTLRLCSYRLSLTELAEVGKQGVADVEEADAVNACMSAQT